MKLEYLYEWVKMALKCYIDKTRNIAIISRLGSASESSDKDESDYDVAERRVRVKRRKSSSERRRSQPELNFCAVDESGGWQRVLGVTCSNSNNNTVHHFYSLPLVYIV